MLIYILANLIHFLEQKYSIALGFRNFGSRPQGFLKFYLELDSQVAYATDTIASARASQP